MAKIKILDLPKDMKVSREDMKKVMGGFDWSREKSSYTDPIIKGGLGGGPIPPMPPIDPGGDDPKWKP